MSVKSKTYQIVLNEETGLNFLTSLTSVVEYNDFCCTLYLANAYLNSDLPSGEHVLLFTLPRRYRPHYNTYAYITKANNQLVGRVYIQIKPNGNVSLYNYSDRSIGTQTALHTSVTWTA